MKIPNQCRALVTVLTILLLSTLCSRPANAAHKPAADVVDSGSFGIFVNGRRVATERFQVTQTAQVSVAKAELKSEDGSKVTQNYELQFSPNGDLRRYEWTSNSKSQAVLEPDNEFLIERVSTGANGKPAERPFMMPASTMVLDDYFFSQRELLIWRYLATQCATKRDEKGCALTKEQFGVIIPQQQAPMQVTVEYAKREMVPVAGVPHEMVRFVLHSDAGDWIVWMDNQYKLQRISAAGQNTEAVRD